jgi:hypothetical protein
MFPGPPNQFDGLPEKKPQLFLSGRILAGNTFRFRLGVTARAHRNNSKLELTDT